MAETNPINNYIIDEYYFTAVGDSSRRSRLTVIILVTASVLCLTSFWNSRQDGWMASRLRVARDAANWFAFSNDSLHTDACVESGAFKAPTYDSVLYKVQKRVERDLSARLQLPPNVVLKRLSTASNAFSQSQADSLEKELFSRMDHAWRFLAVNQIDSRERLNKHLEALGQARVEKVLIVHVPFFGVSFDLNDLGLLGGLTFTIIMMMFRFSLAREHKNLKYVFGLAGQNHAKLELIYDRLAMAQVFTIPKMKGMPEVPEWAAAVRHLLFLPLLVQFVVLVHDLYSFPFGRAISEKNTWIVCIFSFLFLWVVGFLTRSCFLLWRDIDEEWRAQAKTLEIE